MLVYGVGVVFRIRSQSARAYLVLGGIESRLTGNTSSFVRQIESYVTSDKVNGGGVGVRTWLRLVCTVS